MVEELKDCWGSENLRGAESTPDRKNPVKPKTAGKTAKGTGKGKRLTKKQVLAAQVSYENLGGTTSSIINSLADRKIATTGRVRVGILQDMSDYQIGIPCPSFAMEWLVNDVAIALETVVQIYGFRGIGKTGLAFDFMRLFRQLKGIGHYFEHESKFSPTWARSTIGWFDRCMLVIPCYSINEWEAELQKATAAVKNEMIGTKQVLGFGRTFPWLGIVDSIMGKPFQETIDKIETQGFAGRNHPVEALSISAFVKAFAGKLAEWPFMLICINHLKEKTTEQGFKADIRSGGSTIDFQGGYEFKVSRLSRIKAEALDGNKLKIKCMKNSFGIDNREVRVNCVWYDHPWLNPETGKKEMHQRTIWDWDGATVKLLCEDFNKSNEWKRARKICGGLVKVSDGRYYAPKLGIPKTQAVNASELGLKIRTQNNGDLMAQLRRVFSFGDMKIFEPAVDYLDQLKKIKTDFIAAEDEHDG